MSRTSLIAFCFVLTAGAAFAQGKTPYSAAEMKGLLAKGLTVATSDLEGGKHFSGRVNLAADGRLSGSLTPAGQAAIPLSGAWTLKGAQLCRTLAPIQPEEICETWLKTGAKEAIIQVNGKETSVNRWQ